MKATFKNGLGKAIAFLTIVISLFSCTSCEDEPLMKAVVTLSPVENVTESSVTIVTLVTPNQDNTDVALRYKVNNSDWQTQALPTKFSGNSAIKITFDVFDLLPSKSYTFEIITSNAAGLVTVTGSFTTLGLIKTVIKIVAAEDVKISSAKVIASVIPNQDNTEIFMEYQAESSVWISKALGKYSGKDSLKVTLDMSDLQANTNYNVRVKAVNKAGEVISPISSFKTYAVADYDGNLYHTVTIGTQTWLQENFRGTHYANGDPIPNVTNLNSWGTLNTGAYCWYNHDPEIGKIYGGLYNWYVGADPRGLIAGWKTPDEYDFLKLDRFLDSSPMHLAGLMLMEAGYKHWKTTRLPATNSSGFTALPNGHMYKNTKGVYVFDDLGVGCTFWSVSEDADLAALITIWSNDCVFFMGGYVYKYSGNGIRLLKK